MWNTDQFHISKHHARTLFTVIHQHVDTFRAQLSVEFLSQLLHAVRLVHVHWQDRYLERRDVIRPDDSAFVIVLLDSGSNNARYANAVAAHGQNLVTTIFALNGSVHCA